MISRLERAVVLGAGTMGAQLACLLAGAGARVQLLDLDGTVAAQGLERALRLRPSPIYRPEDAARVTTGGFDALEPAVADAGWVIEAVVERLEPKRDLLAKLDDALTGRPEMPIVSSNTSGISILALGEGRSERFRRAFLGTHFFNPPRYARLLELIPGEETDPAVVAWLEEYGSRHLGKGTVRAKDTPAFIANRLGVHGMLVALDLALDLGLGVDEVDELTGPLLGRPRSATFRLIDLIGLDVAVAVADHCFATLPDDPDRERFRVPPTLRTLVERDALGEKRGAGMYKRVDGEILALDLETLEYRPRRRLVSGAAEIARNEPDPGRRLAGLLAADDRAGRFVRGLVGASLGYAAAVAPEIADRAVTVDRAIRWGFGWQLGPFETWDALGVARVSDLLRSDGRRVSELVERVVAGPGAFYRDGPGDRRESLSFADLSFQPIAGSPGGIDIAALRRARPELPSNTAASVIDLGGGILGLELHGKLNVIGLDTLEMIRRAVDLAIERADGLVIATLASDFSAGANLALLLMDAEEGEWDELDRAVRRFQAATRAIRYAPVPVIVAPRGRTLGGGAEICLAGARCQPLAETYLGLVETGVGLIPAGGGSTALARRAAERTAGAPVDGFAFFRAALETIALARVSSSAEEARALGLLGSADLVTADPDRQWTDAAAVARTLGEVGYRPPAERPIAVLGRRGIAAAEALTYNQRAGRYLSEHDRTVVLELARVMSGGDVAEGTELPEAYLLDLEREAFLRLLGERLTRDRIRHTLKTGKPLRN
jgi:3-hydroxyacyl-CoA dehydrogenase